MAADLAQVLNLLIDPPGNLVYHIILTFSVAGALQAALQNWRGAGLPYGKRLVFGLSLLLVTRLALFLTAGAAWQGVLDEHLLPPLDRALSLVSLVLIVWLWAFPQPLRLADYGSLLLALLAVTLMALSLAWWSTQSSDTGFNGSWLDFTGEILALLILFGGGLALILRRPDGLGYGLAMLGLLFLGHLAHLAFIQPQGDYSGVIRLAQLAAFPFLLALPGRLPLTAAGPAQRQSTAAPERRRFGVEPQLARTFLALASETDPARVYQAVTRLVAHTMLADLCLLVFPLEGAEQIVLQSGYDLIREDHLESTALDNRLVPVIDSALRRGLPLRLPASSNSPDLLNLAQLLNLSRAGHLLAAPIHTAEGEPLAQILLLSPYSNRAWTTEDQSYLVDLAASLSRLLQRERLFAALHYEMDGAIQALQAAREESEKARLEREELLDQLTVLQQQANQDRSQAESLTALISAQEEARQQAESSLDQATRLVSRLQQEMEVLNGASLAKGILQVDARIPAQETYREGELRLALEEIARLNAALAAAERRAQEAEGGDSEIPTTPLKNRQGSHEAGPGGISE